VRRILFATLLAASTAHADDFDPLTPDGWPKNLTLDDLRELPECTQPLPHEPGARITCRPPIESEGLQWGLGFDWTTGAVSGTVPTMGGFHALGVEADFALSRAWQVAARYELGGMATPSDAMFESGTALTQHFLSELKYRAFTDEITRRGWVFGVGAGAALRGDELGGSAPMLRASIARELGGFGGGSTTVDGQLELAVEHSQIGAARLDAVTGSVRLGFETNVRTPLGLGQPEPSQGNNAVSFDIYASMWLGLGVSYEVPLTRYLRMVGSASFMFDITSDDKMHGFEGAQWAGLVGPRLQGDLFYLQVQAGGAWIAKDPESEVHGILQPEAGVRMWAGCTSAVDLGAWLRDDLYTNEIIAGGLMMRVVGNAKPNGGHYCRPGLALAMPPPPPPPPPAPPVYVTTPSVEVAVPSVDVNAHVDVAVPVPQPIVVDVVLGVAIPGLSIRLDPRMLPLDHLRGAVRIDVELSGPADALPSFQAQLSGTLSRNGLHVDGIATVADDSSSVHAKFTIYPPGWHP